MQIIPEPKLSTAQLRPQITTTPAIADPTWKPQPCGLTREELRKIVLDLLG